MVKWSVGKWDWFIRLQNSSLINRNCERDNLFHDPCSKIKIVLYVYEVTCSNKHISIPMLIGLFLYLKLFLRTNYGRIASIETRLSISWYTIWSDLHFIHSFIYTVNSITFGYHTQRHVGCEVGIMLLGMVTSQIPTPDIQSHWMVRMIFPTRSFVPFMNDME